jgi:hypothetical protein
MKIKGPWTSSSSSKDPESPRSHAQSDLLAFVIGLAPAEAA